MSGTTRAFGRTEHLPRIRQAGRLTLTDGTPATINLAFTPVNSTATLTGTVSGPAGYPSPTLSLMQQFGTTQTAQTALWQTSATTTVDATFP